MRNVELFIKAMGTIKNSWGSDTPPEAIWGLNEFIDYLVLEYNLTFDKRFDEDPETEEEENINASIIDELKDILLKLKEQNNA